MDLIKLLETISESVYEVVTWLIRVPKTLIKIVVTPAWCSAFLDGELRKDSREQFQEYMPPVLLWILVAVIPIFFLFTLDPESGPGGLKGMKDLYGSTTTALVAYILLLCSMPLSPAYALHLFQHRPFHKGQFRSLFFTQCYLLSPLILLFFLAALLMRALHISEESDLGTLVVSPVGVYSFWLLYHEVKLVRQQLQSGRGKAMLVLLTAGALFMLFACGLFLIVYPLHLMAR
jgi:hypothetical protein